MNNEYAKVFHEIEPVYDKNSKILILGTIPSPKSRENGFFYGHPQNRFWRILSALLEEPLPNSNAEKRAILIKNGIALWDTLKYCEIKNASDTSIIKPEYNDLRLITGIANIRAVFTTGKKAGAFYDKIEWKTDSPHINLPSTSPANAKMRLEELIDAYSVILQYLRS